MNKRRELLIAACASALGAPFATRAQQQPRVARIGYLSALSAAADSAHIEAFRQGLRELGYAEGANLALEVLYANGKSQALPGLAAGLVGRRPDVIVAAPTAAVRAAREATGTIPIVMGFSGDPFGDGLVATLGHPGGNVTGLSAVAGEMAGKRVELLKAIVPSTSRVAFLADASTVKQAVTGTEAAGRSLGIQINAVLVQDPSELDRALSSLGSAHLGGLVVDVTLQYRWKEIQESALRNRLPTASGSPEFADIGGLIAYGPNFPDLFRRAASYVDKILKGAKPGDLPVEQPAKFDMVVNVKTARALGITIPSEILMRADRVIK